MSDWFGIRGYAMKNSIMDYACFFEADLNLARALAGHRPNSNSTKIYTKASIFGAIQKMVNTIYVPCLN